MVEAARRNLVRVNAASAFARADAVHLPFCRESFGVVLAHFMLYHVSDKVRVLEELGRVVRRDGWVGIVLTGTGNMTRVIEAVGDALPGVRIDVSDGARFSADVGEPLIRAAFRSVARHDYEAAMHVTDVDAVVAYARSLSTVQAASLSSAQWAMYATYVADEIAQRGAFVIPKRSSLFMCRA
jgi:SAM-dependent methyltransferase